MALGRRCDLGCETWPDEPLFSTCLICGEPAKRWSNVRPIPLDEAMSALSHYQFELYYERYCAQRGQPVEGALDAAS